jgi:hypothetical protein
VRGSALGLGPQGLHRAGGVVGAVDRRAGHEYVRPRLGAALDGLLVDPAVDLEPDLSAALGHQGAGPAELGQHDVQEVLAAETRFHGHQQQHVDLGQQVLVGLHRGAGIDGQPGARARGANGAQGADRGVHRLGVDRHVARADLGVLRSPPVRLLDHQVTVDRQRGVLEQRLDHRQAQGQVRHEVVVHDIHVQPVGDAGHRGGLVGEPGKVRGQDARGDLNAHSPECRLPAGVCTPPPRG